jgi:hypothetical protein
VTPPVTLLVAQYFITSAIADHVSHCKAGVIKAIAAHAVFWQPEAIAESRPGSWWPA